MRKKIINSGQEKALESEAQQVSSWYLYIVQCKDDSLYTGITTDISRRLKEHNTKKGAFYTKNKTPVKLVYQEDMANQSMARKREAQIKSLTRKEKLELIAGNSMDKEVFVAKDNIKI